MTRKHQRWGWVFVSPHIVSLLLFTLIPLVISVFFSFTRYDMLNPPKWVGLQNYVRNITDPKIWASFRNIWVYGLVFEGFNISIACVLAALLNQKVRALSAFRIIYYIPGLTPVAASALVFSRLYNPKKGILNVLLGYIGLGPFNWNYSLNWFEVIVSVIIMQLWRGVGGAAIYLIAGMQSISNDVIEAADIDGAGPFRKFFKITIPLLTPTIFFLMITGISGALQSFEQFWLLAKETGADVHVVNSKIYMLMWQGTSQVGLAASLGWVSFIFIALVTWGQKKFEKKWVHYDA